MKKEIRIQERLSKMVESFVKNEEEPPELSLPEKVLLYEEDKIEKSKIQQNFDIIDNIENLNEEIEELRTQMEQNSKVQRHLTGAIVLASLLQILIQLFKI